jgi:KaiC/GvpD/RAD55 family RecA-like ATPase
MRELIYANAGDEGFSFILPDNQEPASRIICGGIVKRVDQGHLVTIVGRGGTGKSIFALQLVTALLKDAEKNYDCWHEFQKPSAFYFSLEASPDELQSQMIQFAWGERYKSGSNYDFEGNGLYLIPMPSPKEDLTALILQIRQTIARVLPKIGELVAIVVDPLGGVSLENDLRNELSQLKQLTDSHQTFLFLLSEDHVYESYPAVEHYSQSIIHLDHDPRKQPSRSLYIQKARGQKFFSGYHQFELNSNLGAVVYPSVQAQSAFAHQIRCNEANNDADGHLLGLPDQPYNAFIKPGSALFLMGPPGTFKQYIAANFCTALPNKSAIYISFKADMNSVKTHMKDSEKAGGGLHKINCAVVSLSDDQMHNNKGPVTWFVDARSPLLTPEEILCRVRRAIIPRSDKPNIARAVVWGLRRLTDMPNFAGGKAVQFLEALVTLLKSSGITSLLVDWPDPDKANVLPIVDLSQYILLTRSCKAPHEIDQGLAGDIWLCSKDNSDSFIRERAVILRIQRDDRGFHRDEGFLFYKQKDTTMLKDIPKNVFELWWKKAGNEWEKDPSLQ